MRILPLESDPSRTELAGASPRLLISRIREIAWQRGQERIVLEADRLIRRAEEGRFFLAVVGQFKRGKSTLINALLRESVLPIGVLPVTAVVTIVRHGDAPQAVVEKLDGGEEVVSPASIADYVTEERNPANCRKVAAVIISHPCPLLRSGVCLVDTPGVGSVFELSTEATHAFLPKVDAALVVLGADPPISADEIALLQRITGEVRDFIFVLNKADLVAPADREAAAAFCARIVRERLGRATPEVLPVNAKSRGEDGTSGVEEVAQRITALAERSGSRLVQAAVERGVGRLSRELIGILTLEHRVLTEPIETLESQVQAFHRESEEVGRMLDELGYLLRAEVDRVFQWLNSEALSLLDSEKPALGERVRRGVEGLMDVRKRRLREVALKMSRDLVQKSLNSWLGRMEPRVEEAYRRLTGRFVEASNACAARISAAASRTLGLAVEPTPPELGLRAASRLYYLLEGDQLLLDFGGLAARLADALSSRSRMAQRVADELAERAADWLHTNVTRIVDDLKERLEESLRTFEFDLRDRLEAASRTAQAARERAAALKIQGDLAVAQEVEALGSILSELRGTISGVPSTAGTVSDDEKEHVTSPPGVLDIQGDVP